MHLLTMENFINNYEGLVEDIASIVTTTLELIGIIVIIFGTIKAVFYFCSDVWMKKHHNIRIGLGNSLALALEFKMGAEIIKTVVVREMQELAILGIVIGLRAVLAVLIHWEIKTEKKDEQEAKNDKKEIGFRPFKKLKSRKKEQKVDDINDKTDVEPIENIELTKEVEKKEE